MQSPGKEQLEILERRSKTETGRGGQASLRQESTDRLEFSYGRQSPGAVKSGAQNMRVSNEISLSGRIGRK
jgi:hypothetical protein